MVHSTIKTEIEDGILTVTLNRPEKLNAYTAQMGAEIADVFERANTDDEVRVIIVTGAGRGFCSGADLSSGADSFSADAPASSQGNVDDDARFARAIFNCTKPSIAAVNGAAIGVGATLILPMDIRIAAEGARFGLVFTRRGLVPEAGASWFLPRLVGAAQALRWCLMAETVSAERALAGGLISEVLPGESLLERARAIARTIAESAPVATALTRQLIWRGLGESDPNPVMGLDSRLIRALGPGPDVKEGVQAFMEKRLPRFPGRPSTDMPDAYPWWDR